tara:strand:+ start:503 stop:1147 length:645 start_codon:yes stop_codon:yes gene_type:complete
MLYDENKLKIALDDVKLNFIHKEIEKIKNLKILELGVKNGISTSLFLKICEENGGNLISVDINDCSKLYSNEKWKFIHSRDDNFSKINEEIKRMGGLNLIYIDSYHEPNHVKKIFYNYYNLLSENGLIFIDDISWLPYLKSSYRENKWVEEMNFKTFEKLLEIKLSNENNFKIEFSFEKSGMAKILKLNLNDLNEPKKIERTRTIKSFLREIIN